VTAHHIRYEIDSDGIATLTIDRPEKRNAMTYAMLGAFIDKVAEAGADDKVRVLIVTGSGGGFCAGTDLADLASVPGETRGLRGTARESGKWWPLVDCPKPVIGAIDGLLLQNRVLLTAAAEGRLALAEGAMVKHLVTENAIAAVEKAIAATGNPGLSRHNPLQRHYRDVLCGRVHTPQADMVLTAAGKAAFASAAKREQR